MSTLNFDPAKVSSNLCDPFLPMKGSEPGIAFSICIGFIVKDHLGWSCLSCSQLCHSCKYVLLNCKFLDCVYKKAITIAVVETTTVTVIKSQHLPAGSAISACSSLGLCFNLMLLMCMMAQQILYMFIFSSSLKPKTRAAFCTEKKLF